MQFVYKEGRAVDLRLKGRTVLITGASKGIGLATARAFATEGATCVSPRARAKSSTDARSARQ